MEYIFCIWDRSQAQLFVRWSPRSTPELKMLQRQLPCSVDTSMWFFCRKDSNNGGRSIADTDLFMNLLWEMDLTCHKKSTWNHKSCSVVGLVLSWNWFALIMQLHGNCSCIPAWIYVKALVCYPHSTEGASDGPSWNCLARAFWGFQFEWECARCFSSGKKDPQDGGRSTIHFLSHQTGRLLGSWMGPEKCPCLLRAAPVTFWQPREHGRYFFSLFRILLWLCLSSHKGLPHE